MGEEREGETYYLRGRGRREIYYLRGRGRRERERHII